MLAGIFASVTFVKAGTRRRALLWSATPGKCRPIDQPRIGRNSRD